MPSREQHSRSSFGRKKAVEWRVRRDAGPLSATEQDAFDTWLAADPAHRAAYEEIERLWSGLGSDLASAAESRLLAPAPPLRRLAHPTRATPARRRVRRWRAAGLLAAGVCALAVFRLDLPMRLQADAVSGIGETRTVALPDGSTAVLNTASAIAVRYSSEQRRVLLLRGEAAFTVADDAADRPFSVAAGGGVSTALGTAFEVRRDPGGATVTVVKSRVSVACDEGVGGRRNVALGAGEQVSYRAEDGVGPTRVVDLQQVTAWRRGKLIFVDRSLSEVIDDLDRYYAGRILIVDQPLGATKVNGVFDTGSPVAAVDALEKSLSLRSTRIGGALIVIHR